MVSYIVDSTALDRVVFSLRVFGNWRISLGRNLKDLCKFGRLGEVQGRGRSEDGNFDRAGASYDVSVFGDSAGAHTIIFSLAGEK
jgi:hypothetical protein